MLLLLRSHPLKQMVEGNVLELQRHAEGECTVVGGSQEVGMHLQRPEIAMVVAVAEPDATSAWSGLRSDQAQEQQLVSALVLEVVA